MSARMIGCNNLSKVNDFPALEILFLKLIKFYCRESLSKRNGGRERIKFRIYKHCVDLPCILQLESFAAISKLEEALWIKNMKYDALWCWEMLKLFVQYALRTRIRQRFQRVLQCFLKVFNEFVQRRVSHYKELDPTEHLLLLKAFCELQAQVNP